MSGLKAFRIVLWVAVLAVGGWAGWYFLIRAPQVPTSAEVNSDIGQGTYSLPATDGTTFTQASLVGEPSLVFFGFTHCPDVCPTTLGDIATWQEISGLDIRTFFISVDPARDDLETMADYISWLPNGVGVTGTQEQVDQVISDFRIVAQRMELEDDNYTMNHSAYVMLFDEQGQFNQIFSYQSPPEDVAARLTRFYGTLG